MSDPDQRLLGLAACVSDGAAVDWDTAESGTDDPDERELIRDMKAVARIAEVSRGVPGEAASPTGLGTWGHLRLLERVGVGAFGEVFRAWDTKLDREVALKLLYPEETSEPAVPAQESRALREGRHLARVRHPNVITVYGAEQIAGRVGIWTEFIRGRTAESLLREQGPFGAREAGIVGLDICRALAAVHAAGLVHRDVKADNVLREEGGRILLADFGAGKEMAPAAGDVEDRPVSGTPLYMAPEIFSGAEATVRSDTYALGVLLYHLVTGTYPVRGATVKALRETHARREAQSLRDARPDLPAAFVQVVERALAPDPEERFPSAGQMERALAAAIDVAGQDGARGGPAREPWTAWRRLRALAAAAAMVIPAGIALAWVLMKSDSVRSYTVEAEFYRTREDGLRERLHDGARVAPGDALSMEFRASASAYVYVLSEDERGEAYVLFPLPGLEPSNPVAPDVSHRLPGAWSGRRATWQVTSAGEREHLLVLASREPMTDLDAELASVPRPRPGEPHAYPRLSDGSVQRLRGIGGVIPEPGNRPAGAGERLFERVQRLASRPETARGVWFRRIDLENPRR